MRVLRLLSFCCLALLAIPAAGEVTLRYEWHAGDVFILNKVIDLAGTIRAGTAPPITTSERARIRKKLSVERVDPEGRAQLSVALLSVAATKSVGENELQYSLSPDRVVMDNTQIWQRSAQHEGTSPKVEQLRQLFLPRAMECSARGQTGNFPRANPWLASASQGDLFHLFGVGEEGWVPLPEHPLELGDAWQDGQAQPIRSGTSELGYDARLSLDRLEAEGDGTIAGISFQRQRRLKDISFDLSPTVLNTHPPLQARLVESRQRFTGSVDFHVDEGRLLRCEAKGQVRLRYSLGGGDLPPELRTLVLEYDWDRVRVQSDWERIESN